jgi:hypothetical protein
MTPPSSPPGADDNLPSKRVRGLILALGVWVIGTGFTLVFAQHPQNPFEAFTSKLPFAAIPVVVGVYAGILAIAWAAVPTFKFEFMNELIRTGTTIVGGVFAPHLLSFLFGLLP